MAKAKAKTRTPVKRLRHRNAVSVSQNPTGSKAKNLARSKTKNGRRIAEKKETDLAALEQEINDSREKS